MPGEVSHVNSKAAGSRARGGGMLFILRGMKRSGNHAIAHWLEPQLESYFVNNLFPIAAILAGEAPWPVPVAYSQALRSWGQDERAVVLVGIEDHALELEPFCEVGVPIQEILLVRHPDNLFASRIRKAFTIDHIAYPRTNNDVMHRIVRLWKEHARAYLSRRTSGAVGVYFDAWFRSQPYRRRVSECLGAVFSDNGFSLVASEGGGSSFDGVACNGQNTRMGVTSRRALLSPTELALLDDIYLDTEIPALGASLDAADHMSLTKTSLD